MNISPWFVLLLGMGTVFFGLICLIFITKLMSLVLKKVLKEKKPAEKAPAVPAQAPQAPVSTGGIAFADRKLLDAIIAASIAAYDGGDMRGLRIRSIRQIGGGNAGDRGQFVAAVAASIATAMGTDVEGLRIHSIKKI